MPQKMMTSREERSLRLLSFGAGAIGTYIGGSLALRGHSVTFLERPAVAANLLQRGIHLQLGPQIHNISNPIVASSLEEALAGEPFDAALFALKSYDTPSALETLQPFKDRLPPILCLQNGVENEPALTEVLGGDKVIAGSVTSAVGRRDAGDVVLEKLRGVGIFAGHSLSAKLVEAFNVAGLNARSYSRALDMKWSKMLTNLLANASSAILDMTPAEIFDDPRLCRLETGQLREALHVMDALGIRVVDLPGLPVRLLAFAVRFLPDQLSRPFFKKSVGGGRGGKMPSFYIDLKSGRGVSEVDYLNGAVVRFGQRAGVLAPINDFLNRKLSALTRGELPVETFAHQPGKLLHELNVGIGAHQKGS
jgi:2-dehydropantoate 2-reductase